MSHADSHDDHDDHGHSGHVRLNGFDVIVILVMVVVFFALIGKGIYQDMHGEGLRWFSYISFAIAGMGALIVSYILIRVGHAASGTVDWSEMIGWGLAPIGAIFLFLCLSSDKFLNEARQNANPIEAYAPPVIRLDDYKQPIDLEQVKFIRFPQTTVSGNPDKIYVLYVIDGKDATDKVVIPKGMHGQVWYEIGGRKSLSVEH